MDIQKLAQELQTAQQEVVVSLAGASERELHTAPEPGEWTASEVAAHVIEMQAMWMEKIANAGQEPDLARSHSEIERRTESVDAHSGDNLDTITRRLAGSCGRTVEILQGMSSSDLDRPVTYGHTAASGTALEAARSLVISHLSEHAQQITETRRAAGGG
ncbi:MAG: DinB family protein [Dehalococcoidia bacterium]|nr:DinB family protein [Dehalococcoidia bacterium]